MIKKILTADLQMINQQLINKIVDKLQQLKIWWENNKVSMLKEQEIILNTYQEYILRKINKIREKYSYLDEEDIKNLDAILRRGILNIKKILILDALIKDNKKITKQSINKVITLFEKCLLSVKDLIWSASTKQKTTGEKHLDAILKYLTKHFSRENNCLERK